MPQSGLYPLGGSPHVDRFRANIYAHFEGMTGFAEEALIGRELQLGAKAVIAVTDRAASAGDGP